jgi:hypothetical protein
MTTTSDDFPVFPCRCAWGHGFTDEEAEALHFVCDICGAAIVCPPVPLPAPVVPDDE